MRQSSDRSQNSDEAPTAGISVRNSMLELGVDRLAFRVLDPEIALESRQVQSCLMPELKESKVEIQIEFYLLWKFPRCNFISYSSLASSTPGWQLKHLVDDVVTSKPLRV